MFVIPVLTFPLTARLINRWLVHFTIRSLPSLNTKCIACPEHSETMSTITTSLEDCRCVEGYFADDDDEASCVVGGITDEAGNLRARYFDCGRKSSVVGGREPQALPLYIGLVTSCYFTLKYTICPKSLSLFPHATPLEVSGWKRLCRRQ